jgi:PAS domain S-box-containing protein
LSSLNRTFRIIIWILLSLVFAICTIDISSQLFGLSSRSGLWIPWEPMKVITASCFVVSAFSLAILNSELSNSFKRVLSVFFAAIICGVSIIYVYLYLYNLISGHESILTQYHSLRFFLSPAKFMPFLTSWNFLFTGIILFLFLSDNEELSNIAHLLIAPVFLISYFIIIRRILEVYTASELKQISTSPDTGLVFCGLIGVILLMRPGTWLMKLVTSPDIAGIISRKLFPPLIILPVIIGWLRIHGERIGIIKSEEGVIIVAVAYTACFLLLIWLTARYIEKTDSKRRSAENELRESEGRLKSHIENSPLAVIEWGQDFIVTKWSGEAERIFGWTREEVLGLRIDKLNMIFEEDIPVVEKTMARLTGGKEMKVVSENRNYTKKRDIRNCIWYNSVLNDEKGQMSSVMSLVEDVTEMRNFEKLLKESEEKLWSVLNATQESIYMFDRNGIITMSNLTGLHRLQIKSEYDLIGHHFSKFMTPATAILRQSKLDEVFRTGEPIEFEDERDCRIYRHNFFPVFKDNQVLHVVTYSSDITDRKRAESKLMESEDRFRTIAESLTVMISIERLCDSTLTFINEPFETTFGYSKEELSGKRLPDSFYSNDDLIEINETLRRFGKLNNKEVRIKKSDGSPLWIMLSVRTINFMNETSYLSASIDITETKNIQLELLRLNRTLDAQRKSSQAMMHSNNEFNYLNEVCRIIVEDCGQTMVWIGYVQADERKSVKPVAYFGFDQSYIEQLNVSWDDSERGRGPTGTAIRTGKPSICKNMLTDPDFKPWRDAAKKRGYASSLVLPLLSEGRAFGAISIYSKEPDSFSESEIDLLNELADDLAYGISYIRLTESERAATIAFKQNEVKLKELVATKDKFFNIVAHDLKNPFTSLLGSSELLTDNIDQMSVENIRELALILNDSAKAGYAILQNLLDWSRSQTGMLKFNPEKINLKTIIDENIDNLQLQSNNKGLYMSTELTEDLFIFADKNMINTVLRNLLSNAVKYTFKNGTVLVGVTPTPEEILIKVKDSGTGITEEKVETLFKIENSLSQPGTEKEQGTGLGLKLCKEFTEKMGGRIWVESEVGKGCEFKFTIPLNGVKVQGRKGTTA